MRYRALLSICFVGSCLAPKPPTVPIGWHLTLTAESVPAWSETCLERCRALPHGALSLVLRRDPIENAPEWVSGHRMALAVALETLEPQTLIIEAPRADTAFYPSRDAAFWHEALQRWVLTELLPFLSTYPTIERVAWGRGFEALPDSFWVITLRIARKAAPALHWGISLKAPQLAPAQSIWDFIGLDASESTEPPSPAWVALHKPLYLFYPPSGIYEPDTLQQLLKAWNIPLEAAFLYTNQTIPSLCQKSS